MFPFDKIKIDKSFISGLEDDTSARSIVDAILAMERSLGMDVIAEGIETEQQLTIMRQMRCPAMQGFFLGKPLPGEAIRQYLDDIAARERQRLQSRVSRPVPASRRTQRVKLKSSVAEQPTRAVKAISRFSPT
jgi:predicted signal transduction protein with EAL and GGDEF domain